MKSWLHDNEIELYSRHNEGQSVPAETFITTLKNKIYKQMKKIYIDKLDYIVNKYNNTYHSTIIMNPAGVKSSTYIKLVIM